MTTDVRTLLAQAARHLDAAGIPTPRVDAELLLADLLDVPRSQLATRTAIPDSAAAEYRARVERRANREPLQHIGGVAWFRHVRLEVGPGVFVPRPETELLVDEVLSQLRAAPDPLVVDLCSGSGALALAVADEVPGAQVVAVERSMAAVRWLQRNAAGTAVRVIAGDIRDPELLREYAGRAAAVLANPPYVPDGTEVDPEVRADPHEAVFAGDDGLDLIPTVLVRAAQLLAPGGRLAMEHDDTQADAVISMLRADSVWIDVAARHDLAGRPRYVAATRQ